MAEITPKDTIKSWFKRGLKPLETQFHAWMDSYWHKSEKLSVSNIDKLETILNKKAESATVDQLGKNFNAHIQNTSLHKTEEERYQLGHLARDPEATYAKKEDVKYIEPLILHAIYTVDAETGKRTYTFPEDERSLVVDYFDNQDARLVVLFVSETEESAEYESYVMTESEIRSVNRVMQFGRIHSPESSNFNCYYRLMLQYTQPPEGDAVGFVLSGIEVDFIADPVEFYVRAEKEGDKYAYTLEEGQKEVFADYFLNKAAHRNATLRITRTDTGGHDTLGLTWRRSPGEGKTGTYQLVFNRMSLDGTEGMSTFILSSACTSHPETWTDILLSTDEYGMGGGEPVVFTATYSSDTNTYTLDPGQDAKFEAYIDNNKSTPAFLHITDTGAPWYTAVLEHVDTSTTTKKMLFSVLDSGIIVQFVIKKLKLSLGWTGTLSLSQNSYPIEESEYKWERYYPETDFDMNEWFESGGISAAIYEGVEGEYEGIAGSNMPEGFTEFTGYVLAAIGLKSKSRKASIQVVTDKVLKKTMMRTGYERESSREEHEWLPWVEIGGSQSPSVDPVVFTGTVAISGTDKTYALDDGQTSKFTQYFDDGMEVPVLLKFSSDSNYLHNEIFVLQDTTINGSARRMNFVDIGTGVITKLYLQMSRISSGAWVGVVKLITNEYKFGEPEYNANRYFGNDFDMNECTESGGILATSTETAPSAIQNGPGFDNFTGFVLKSLTITGDKKTCTQVVSDRDTGRIMMRFAYLESDFANVVWSEWKEIGGAPAGDNVYVVQEYPSDLSQYADGSIFIKEEAAL